jgi:hypothetical protein
MEDLTQKRIEARKQLEWWRARLKLYESDLKDSRDPKVLARWPNLGAPELIDQTVCQIREAKKMIALLEPLNAQSE